MIYVMSDLHGQYEKYKSMLKLIDFNENDTMYILGDVIDRGNHGIQILQDMMMYSNIFPLVGNHEYMAIKCMKWLNEEVTLESIGSLNEEMFIDYLNWMNNGGQCTLNELKVLSKEERKDVIEYMLDFSSYEEVEMNDKYFILVHAGLGHFDQRKKLSDYTLDELVWERPDLEKTYFDNPNVYIVSGHTPTFALHHKAEIFHSHNNIVIDCGAAFSEGKLACLCLDNMQEFYV